jgi:hypothetical protein
MQRINSMRLGRLGHETASANLRLWTPDEIEGLIDIDPDDLAGNDGDTVGSITTKGAAVVEFAQADDGRRPLLKTGANGINGHNTLLFDGSNDLLVAGSAFLNSQAGAVFIVFRTPAALQAGELLTANDLGSSSRRVFVRGAVAATNYYIGFVQDNNDTDDSLRGNVALETSRAYVGCWQSNGTAYTMRLSQAPQTLVALGGANTGDWFGDVTGLDNVVLGAIKDQTSERSFWKGEIARVLIYTSALTDEERSQVEDYLMTRYAVSGFG